MRDTNWDTLKRGDVLARFDLRTWESNNIVCFRDSLMAAAGALITTKYGPLGWRIVLRFLAGILSEKPAFLSPTDASVLPRFGGIMDTAVHGDGPRYRNLTSKHDKAHVRTGNPDGSFIINAQDWNNPFPFLPLNLYRRWNEAIEKGKKERFRRTYRSQLIGPSKKQLAPCGYARRIAIEWYRIMKDCIKYIYEKYHRIFINSCQAENWCTEQINYSITLNASYYRLMI